MLVLPITPNFDFPSQSTTSLFNIYFFIFYGNYLIKVGKNIISTCKSKIGSWLVIVLCPIIHNIAQKYSLFTQKEQ